MHVEGWLAGGAPPPGGGDALDPDAALAGLAEALGSLATFAGADRVTLGRVAPRRLRASLARRLRGVACGVPPPTVSSAR